MRAKKKDRERKKESSVTFHSIVILTEKLTDYSNGFYFRTFQNVVKIHKKS